MKVEIYKQYTEDFKQDFYCEKVVFENGKVTLLTELGTKRVIDRNNEYIKLKHNLLALK